MTAQDALARDAVLIRATDVAAMTAAIHAAAGAPSLLVLIDGTAEPLELALLVAAVAPLAGELAPRTRVNAIVAGRNADPADVAVAAGWLSGAASTTGQVLRISAAAYRGSACSHGPS